MKASDCMQSTPVFCRDSDTLTHAAKLMRNYDIGFLPVLAGGDMKGVITDRDIITRGIAEGKDPDSAPVSECMSTPVVFVQIHHELSTCLDLMKERQVKRVAVVDMEGNCCGVISQKDLSQATAPEIVGEVSRHVTQPT